MAAKIRSKDRRNPKMTCFCCGKRIVNRYSNSYYCSECSRIVSKIREKIHSVIYNNGIRKMELLKDYDFKITVNVIKRNDSRDLLLPATKH